METIEKTLTYQSLGDIRLQKARLQTDIIKEENRARRIVDGMLHPKKDAKPRKRSMQSMINMSIGVVDGALFAWKIYRKFGGKGKAGFRILGRKK